MKKQVTFFLALILALIPLAGACAKAENPENPAPAAPAEETKLPAASEETQASAGEEGNFEDRGYKVAYIINTSPGEIFQMAFDSFTDECSRLGIQADTYHSNADDVVFQDMVMQFAAQGYDGIVLSHGKKEYGYTLAKTLADQGIAVVCNDIPLANPDTGEENVHIEGVAEMGQDDWKMMEIAIDLLRERMGDKMDKGPLNVIKLKRAPGVVSHDRREAVFQENIGLFHTLADMAPPDLTNSEGSMNQAIAALLPKYPVGSVDVILSYTNPYSRGAYNALIEAGRSDIPIISFDLSNQDLVYMRENPDIFWAAICTDYRATGAYAARLLAKELHGDPPTEPYYIEPTAILAASLNADSNVANLGEINPDYGITDEWIEEWMIDCYKRQGLAYVK